MTRTAQTPKEASGLLVYLVEELGDARLRCAQLKKYVKDATDIIEKSEHRDHFFEVAGNLIYGIPDTLMKLDKALDATALAAGRLDYEEIKNGLRPEKADELESALQETRLRYLNRRSNEMSRKESVTMNAKTAAYFLNKIADLTDKQGRVPVAAVLTLVAHLERGSRKSAALNSKASTAFRNLGKSITSTKNPSRTALAGVLRRIVGDTLQVGIEEQQQGQQGQGQQQQQAQQEGQQPQGQGQQQQQSGLQFPYAGAGEDFQKANPKITDEEAKVITEMHEKNKDVVKDKHQ
jgi:hypothetical protein